MILSRLNHAAARIAALLGGILCIPALVIGGALLLAWVRTWTHDVPYFDYNYARLGTFYLLLGALGIVAAARAMMTRRFQWIAVIIAVVAGFLGARTIPDTDPKTVLTLRGSTLLNYADYRIASWADGRGRLPKTENELQQALLDRPMPVPWLFSENHTALPYRVRFVPDVDSPIIAQVPQEPGTFIYVISKDSREYWLTMSTLSKPVGGRVVILSTDDKPRIEHRRR